MGSSPPIETAQIEWRDGLPYSPLFDDVYFSKNGGMAETEHVFLKGNRLAERFTRRNRFAIGETGFGTGLNFLCAYRLWRQTAQPGARLTYFSIENHPLDRDDLARAAANWPELHEETAILIEVYPPAVPGFHLRHLPHGVTLILAYGEAHTMLAEFEGECDAWFLDGFTPARNPAMWQAELWPLLAAHTAAGGTLATFTAAGEVRRGLAASGFTVERQPGFAGKRHMTIAQWPGAGRDAPYPKTAVVIGAGIAGASAARALAEKGVRVTLLEKEACAATGGSGNPAAILFPLLQREWQPAGRFYMAAYLHLLDRLKFMSPVLQQGLIGMIQLPKKQRGVRDAEGLLAIAAKLGLPPAIARPVSQAEASELSVLALPLPGLYFQGGGWLCLADFVSVLIDHPNIHLHCNENVLAVNKLSEVWQIETVENIHQSDLVIISNATGNIVFYEKSFPIAKLRGQISSMSKNERTSVQQKVVCFGGYLLPALAGRHFLGATYERAIDHAEILSESHRLNLAKLADVLPEIAESWRRDSHDRVAESVTGDDWQGWAGFRAVTPDRLPLIGALKQGLYASIGHGSRGAVSAMLAGEIVAAMACGEPLPVERSVLAHLSPQRFSHGKSKHVGGT